MNKKIGAALALVLVIALTVTAYYSLSALYDLEQQASPSPTPKPTPTPTPTIPTDRNTTVTDWAQRYASYPTELTITSPQNKTFQAASITLTVNVTTSFWAINSVYYKADWLEEYQRIFSISSSSLKGMSNAITLTANFTGIPDGCRTIEVVANYHDGSHIYGTVNFTVKK